MEHNSFLLLFVFFLSVQEVYPKTIIEIEHNYTQKNSTYHPEVLNFIDMLTVKYRSFSRERLLTLFKKVKLDDPLQIQLSNKLKYPAEKVKDWNSYRKQFVNSQRVKAGVEFFKKNEVLIKKVSKKFQVPVSIILATIGVESYYGKSPYKYPVFSSLVINGFANDYRNEFYINQLEYFLIMVHRNNFTDEEIFQVYGSYSGAIGPAQFIPFSIHHYGYDFDRNGKVDMIGSYPDVLGSIANYYHKNGWSNKKKVISKVKKPCKKEKDIFVLPSKGGNSTCWKKEHNFKVILTYNRNNFYAFSLYILSRKLDSEIKKL